MKTSKLPKLGKKKRVIKSSVFSKRSINKMLSADSPFGVKESYASVRTQLLFSRKSEKCPVFVVTSMIPGEGKSLNCVNIAISFAQLNKRVLVIDADMRNPTVHRFFSLNCANGLSELLGGFADTVNFKASGVENLTILTAGELPVNPSELLNSEQMDKLLRLVREHFDFVFIDTPPVGLVVDPSALAQKVTGYVIVARPGHSDISEIKKGVSTLKELGGNVIGFVCNNADDKMRNTSGYYGRYYRKYSSYNYGYYGHKDKNED